MIAQIKRKLYESLLKVNYSIPAFRLHLRKNINNQLDESRRIAVAITHYNNAEKLHYSLFNLINDTRVSQIVILDDCSDKGNFEKLVKLLKICPHKVGLYRRDVNWGPFANKIQAVALSPEPWTLLLDCDNTYYQSSINRLFKIQQWNADTIYCPSFAFPHFNFKEILNASPINKQNLLKWIRSKSFSAPFLNDGNYFLHRDNYLSVAKSHFDLNPYAADVLLSNLLWIAKGKSLELVDELIYLHRIFSDSAWSSEDDKSTEIMNKLMSIAESKGDITLKIQEELGNKPITWIEPKKVIL